MSDPAFRNLYAEHYDNLYREKDYEAECDLLEEMFHRYCHGQIRKILDLGCGTGGHVFPLTLRGYEVIGVDQSEEMFLQANLKSKTISLEKGMHPPVFIKENIRSMELGESFDAALMMFAVLSYQQTNEDVLAALHTVRRHLRPGGIFLADFWYGPAVIKIGPSERIKVVDLEDGTLIRAATPRLDISKHICYVNYTVWHLVGDQLINHSQEEHALRFFFPMELTQYLNLAKLEVVGLYPFPNIEDTVDSTTWNVLLCGRAIP